MKSIKINESFSISEKTTASDLAMAISKNIFSQYDRERAIVIYGKFQAKKVRYEAVELVQSHIGGLRCSEALINEIHNVN